MNGNVDLDALFAEMDAAADRAELTLNGQFADFYKGLRNLSPEEIDDITPDTTDQKEYERLIALVQQATQQNLDQAQLIERIKALGDIAIAIAKKVPSIAALL